MKKILCLILVLLILLTTACAPEVVNAPPNPNYKPAPSMETFEPTESMKALASEEIIFETTYASMIPDPKIIFPNGGMVITDSDGGKAYTFSITGYTVDEYATYVSKCEEMGFTDVAYNTGTEFGAYTDNKQYWVEVLLDDTDNVIYIVCQTSNKE